jgi:hypothetical protein
MKLTPRTDAEKQKDRIALIRNAEKAGLTYMGGNVFKDEEVYPTQYYRFGSPKSVKDFKAAIDSRMDGNKESYAVQLHDFTNIIPDEILDTIVNRRIRGYLETKIAKEMSDHNLDTSIPDNLYDPNRESTNSIRSYFTSTDYEEGAGYSYDLCKW